MDLVDIADEFQMSLIGGDVTKGPLNINVVVYGTPYNSKFLKEMELKRETLSALQSLLAEQKKA